MSGPAAAGVAKTEPGQGEARALLRLPRSLRDNAVFMRQLTVGIGGTKLALVFLLVNAALIFATLSAIAACLEGDTWLDPMGAAGLGRFLSPTFGCVTYGLLALLLPLRVAGLFEGARLDHAFDQVVVTGTPPGRLHRGNWAQAMAYVLVVLLATLPYQAFAHAARGVTAFSIARDYGVLFAYSNVIVLVSMALGVVMTEFAAAPLSILLFAALGGLSFAPLPSALAHWTPIRWFLRSGFGPLFESSSWERMYYGPPVLFFQPLPDWMVMAGLWGLVAAGALLFLGLGPAHVFSPGLNNFGHVVLPGDRKRSRLRTLRLHLTRHVEMAFLYENRSRRWDAWDWPLRAGAILVALAAFWTVMMGLIFLWFRFSEAFLEMAQVYVLVMGGLGLGFALLAYGESRERIYAWQRVGPLSVPRGLLSFAYFSVALAAFAAFTYLPIHHAAERGLALAAQQSSPTFRDPLILKIRSELELFPGRMAILALFAAVLYLVGRLLARTVASPRGCRVGLLCMGVLALFLPLVLVPLYEERILASRPLAALIFLSPVAAMMESFSPEGSPFRAQLGAGGGMPYFFLIHGGLLAGLALWLVLLNVRRAVRLRRSPALAGAAAAVRAGCLVLGLLVLGSRSVSAGDVTAEVVRGFAGHSFSGFDHFTVVLSRGQPGSGEGAALPVEISFETLAGEGYVPPSRVEVPPGTRLAVRLAAPPRRDSRGSTDALKLVLRAEGGRQEIEVAPAILDGASDAVRLLCVSEMGKVPPLVLPSQRWVGTAATWLPERPEAYGGADVVLVGPTDWSAWTPLQRRALLDFVRSGGTVLFFGAIDERALAAAPEWADLLRARGPARTDVDEIPFHVRPLAVGRTVWSEGTGEKALPVLQLRSLGPGTVGHLAVDPLLAATAGRFGGPGQFWMKVLSLTPASLCGSQPLVDAFPRRASGGGESLLVVACYFAAYALILGPAMLLLFRARRRRIWVWVYAPAVSLAFVLGSPLLFMAMEANPSPATVSSFRIFGIHGGEGVSHASITVWSSGRHAHRLTIRGEDVTAFETATAWARRYGGSRSLSSLGSGRGAEAVEAALNVLPWGSRGCFALATLQGVAPARGMVSDQGKKGFDFEVHGLKPGTEAWLIVIVDDKQGAPEGGTWATMSIKQSIKAAGPARGSLSSPYTSAVSRGGHFQLGAWDPRYDFHFNRPLRPRAFVMWKEPPSSPVVESADLSFDVDDGQQVYSLVELEVTVPEEAPAGGKKEP